MMGKITVPSMRIPLTPTLSRQSNRPDHGGRGIFRMGKFAGQSQSMNQRR
ncbi:MAG: hypothetical protein ACM3N7_13470 [Planctomycetaceae bacterium]